jgi:hypothetical protein
MKNAAQPKRDAKGGWMTYASMDPKTFAAAIASKVSR